MRFEVPVRLESGNIKRFVTFTGDREGYFENEAGVKTCRFWFSTFADVRFESYKDGKEYRAKDVGTTHPIQKAASAVREAYDARRKWQWAQEGKKTA
jgi:cation transport regulator ChaB